MKQNKFWVVIGLILILAMLAACTGAATPAPAVEQAPGTPAQEEAPAEAAAPAGPFRVAVVMPSAINDLAFSQSMYDSLLAIQQERGEANFEIAYSDGMFVVDDASAAIRDYASQGYDLIIAHGSQYGSSLQEIAPDFPDTSFAWGTTVDTFADQGITNVFAYTTESNQGGYVEGVMAALLTQSGTVGVIGPIDAGDAKLTVRGFAKGVTDTDPNVKVLEVFTGSFSDVSLAAQAAQTHIEAGADLLTGTAQMVVGAIGVAKEKGVPWFGNQASQTSLAPDLVVANQVYDWTVALNPIIQSIQSGKLGGEAYSLTLANGGLKMEFNDNFNLPPEVKAKAEETIQGIIAGRIDATIPEEGAAPAAAAATPAPAQEPIRVAVVMPSAINDLAFSQSMYDSLLAIQQERGEANFEIAYSDGMFVVDDASAAIRDYASQGYDLIIAHGSQYGSSLQEIAPDFPDTSFAWGTTVDTFADQGITNVFAYTTESNQGGYVEGVMAALLTQSGTVGVIGPIDAGDAKLTVRGFAKGVTDTDPNVKVLEVFTGSFSDVSLAAQAAQTHIEAGADLLTGTAQMVVGAIGVAKEKGVPWFGNQASQTSLAPDLVVANQVYDWTVALNPIIQSIQSGKLGGEAYSLTLANGGLKMEFNDNFNLPPEVKAKAEETIQGIIAGSIDASIPE